MNRKELAARVAERTGMLRKDVDQVLGAVIDEIQEQLSKGESIKLQGLGTFEIKTRAARKARDLSRGGIVEVPARRAPTFKASSLLRELIENSGSGVPGRATTEILASGELKTSHMDDLADKANLADC